MVESFLSAIDTLFNTLTYLASYLAVSMMLYTRLISLPHNAMHLVDIKVARQMSIRPQIYVNVQYHSIISSFCTSVHAWCHAVFRVKSFIITHGNKILHVTRRGISRGIYMQIYLTCVIYTVQLLATDASNKINENDY